MKIVYYTDADDYGGSEMALLRLMRSLDRQHWQPVLFYHQHARLQPFLDAVQALDIPVKAIPPLPLGLKGLSNLLAMIRQLKEVKPDVFHANLSWALSGKWGLAGAILARVPAILATFHLVMDIPYSLSARVQQRLMSLFIDQYVAISATIADQLRRIFWLPGEKLEVIYNGVSMEQLIRPADAGKRAALAGDAQRPVVLTVARYDPQKGLSYLIEAAAHVPKAVFLLAGDGPERLSLESQAQKLGVQDRVQFLGYRDDVHDLLAICDLFVLPSLYEGMPLALLEAMGAGKPVIATDLPGCLELITHGENGWIVPAANSTALAEGVQLLLSQPELANRLAQAGQSHVRNNFSIDTANRRFVELYQKHLAKL